VEAEGAACSDVAKKGARRPVLEALEASVSEHPRLGRPVLQSHSDGLARVGPHGGGDALPGLTYERTVGSLYEFRRRGWTLSRQV
jgi:hypothetical protein